MKKPEPPRMTKKCSECGQPPYNEQSENQALWVYKCLSCKDRKATGSTKEEARNNWDKMQVRENG
jgi:DNA replicative helicase MCM subunit Mcm2 (Cdc46/Mcm family)